MTQRDKRRVRRARLAKPLPVVAQSIGSQVKYDLWTRDVSDNGFFLDFERPGRFPFTPESILEVWLELHPDNWLFFNGKMARVVNEGDPEAEVTGTGIAIKIVQIDAENQEKLMSFLESSQLIIQEKTS